MMLHHCLPVQMYAYAMNAWHVLSIFLLDKMNRGATNKSKYLQNSAVIQAQIQNESLLDRSRGLATDGSKRQRIQNPRPAAGSLVKRGKFVFLVRRVNTIVFEAKPNHQ